MVNKNLVFLFGILIIIFLLFQINFINSQELTDLCITSNIGCGETTFYGTGYEVSQEGEIIFNSEDSKLIINQGQENEIIIEGNSGIKVSPLGKISVIDSGAVFSINGNSFENIEAGEIIFDQTSGKITNADFYTNENLGNYNLNGNEFDVPANSRFVYDSKKEEFQLSSGTEVKKIKTAAKISGKDLKFWKENKQHDFSGNLDFDESGNTFISAKERVIINGISLENEGKGPDFPIFFDKSSAAASGKIEYIVIDPSKNLFAFKESGGNLPRNIRVEFNKDNYLFGDLMDEKDYLFIGEGGVDPGYLEITRQGGNLPVVKTQGFIEINPDEKRFLFEGENIIFKTGTNAWPIPEDRSMIGGIVPMVFESQDRKVVGLIPDNDDKRFYWTSKGGEVAYGPISGVTEEQLGVELPDEITKSWAENSEVTQDRTNTISTLANDEEIKKDYKNYLVADKVFKKYKIEIEKLEEELLIKQKQGKDPSISWAELEKKWGIEKTNEIKTALKSRTKLIDDIYSKIKVEKDIIDIAKFNVEEELLKVMSPEEIKALNNCEARGGSFDDCFDENYKYLGHLTFKCITDSNYCEKLTFYKFNKMRTQ